MKKNPERKERRRAMQNKNRCKRKQPCHGRSKLDKERLLAERKSVLANTGVKAV